MVEYEKEVHLFIALKGAGQPVKQAEFCKRRSSELGEKVALRSFKRHLAQFQKSAGQKGDSPVSANKRVEDFKSNNRYDWHRMKAEFLSGPWKTVAQFGRDIGASYNASHFKKMTKGWQKEKALIGKQIVAKTFEKLIEDEVAEKARNITNEMLSVYWKVADGINKTAESICKWKIGSLYQSSLACQTLLKLQLAIERLIPNIRELEGTQKMGEVLDALAAGTMDGSQAGIELLKLGVRLPKVIELMISKDYEVEPLDDDGDMITEEKIIARRQEMLRNYEKQLLEFVPTRTKEIKELKQELANTDSFAHQQGIESER